MYYVDKIETLKEVFNATNVSCGSGFLMIDEKKYPIVDDVIILIEPACYTNYVKGKISGSKLSAEKKGHIL